MTSRGQADWYGWQYMNRRFEQESTTSYLNYRYYKESLKPMPKNDQEALEEWIEEVQQSSWAIKSDDAHKKAYIMYVN